MVTKTNKKQLNFITLLLENVKENKKGASSKDFERGLKTIPSTFIFVLRITRQIGSYKVVLKNGMSFYPSDLKNIEKVLK